MAWKQYQACSACPRPWCASEQQETQEIARGVLCCLGLGEHVLTQGTCRGKIARLLVQPGHRELQQLARQVMSIALGHV